MGKGKVTGKKADVVDVDVPKTNAPGAAETEEKKAKVLIPDIIRGRMPILVVHMARFGDQANTETVAMAKMFGTTAGKIADIKRKSTFGYLPENFRPVASQVEEAVAYFKRHVDYDKGGVDKLIDEATGYKLATPEQAAEFERVRVAARGQLTKTKTGKEVDAGGGNRKVGKPKKAEKTDKSVTAADLMG